MIPKFISNASKALDARSATVESAALVLAGTGIFGSLLSILKNSLLASRFGVTTDLDIYFAAFRIPDFFYSALVFGALSAGFMPIFSKSLLEGKEKAWQLVSSLLTVFVVVLGLAAVFVFIFAPKIAEILVPGFGSQAIGEVAKILRILMAQPILLAISSVIGSTLQSFRRFFAYSLAPVLYNVGIIIGILWFSNFWGIFGVVWGVILGAFLHLLIQLSSFRALGFHYNFRFWQAFRGLKEIFVLMLPRSIALAVGQLNLLALTSIASLLPIGTLAIFNFADTLQSVPQTIFALSFATAAFPMLSQLWAKTDSETFRKLFSKTFVEVIRWIIPASLILAAFRNPIVAVLFAHGGFDVVAQEKTVDAFSVFLLGLPAQAVLLLLARTFFAMGDSRTPLVSSLVAVLATVISAFYLGNNFEAAGLAGAVSLGSWLNVLILLFILSRSLGDLYFRQTLKIVSRSILLGSVAAFTGWVTLRLTYIFIEGETFFVTLLRLFIALMPVGIVIFVGVLMLKILDIKHFEDKIEPS